MAGDNITPEEVKAFLAELFPEGFKDSFPAFCRDAEVLKKDVNELARLTLPQLNEIMKDLIGCRSDIAEGNIASLVARTERMNDHLEAVKRRAQFALVSKKDR